MSVQPSTSERIVAVGLLTQRDIDILGTGFRRMFPVARDRSFEELLRRLDAVTGTADPASN